jgi:hypothetical protein
MIGIKSTRHLNSLLEGQIHIPYNKGRIPIPHGQGPVSHGQGPEYRRGLVPHGHMHAPQARRPLPHGQGLVPFGQGLEGKEKSSSFICMYNFDYIHMYMKGWIIYIYVYRWKIRVFTSINIHIYIYKYIYFIFIYKHSIRMSRASAERPNTRTPGPNRRYPFCKVSILCLTSFQIYKERHVEKDM